MRWKECEAALRPVVERILREEAEEEHPLEEPRVLAFVLVSEIAMWIHLNFGLEPDERGN